jgi:hypothetical protein
MLLLLPMDGDDAQASKLCALNDVKKWALMQIEAGQVTQMHFYDQREAISEWIDAVIVVSDSEYLWPFQEENIAVLVAHTQRFIDDIVEAFLFKELHELSY